MTSILKQPVLTNHFFIIYFPYFHFKNEFIHHWSKLLKKGETKRTELSRGMGASYSMFKLLIERIFPAWMEHEMVKVKVKSLSRVLLFATPWTVAYEAPWSVEFSRQEYWSGLPFPSPGDLSNPGIKPGSPALQADIYRLSQSNQAPKTISSLSQYSDCTRQCAYSISSYSHRNTAR